MEYASGGELFSSHFWQMKARVCGGTQENKTFTHKEAIDLVMIPLVSAIAFSNIVS